MSRQQQSRDAFAEHQAAIDAYTAALSAAFPADGPPNMGALPAFVEATRRMVNAGTAVADLLRDALPHLSEPSYLWPDPDARPTY